MSKYSIIRVKVPDINRSFKSGTLDYSKPEVKRANIAMIKKINANYKSSIERWGKLFETGSELLIGFIATESGGIMAPPNRFKATGLMQMTPPAFYDIVKKWKAEVDSDIPPEAMSIINARIPEISTAKTLSTPLSNKIISLLQRDADFNIMSGTMMIRWLLERFSSPIFGGQLNKTLVAYNAGAYRSVLNSSPVIDTARLVASPLVPKESQGYLLKMLGKDGFMQLIIIDKALTK
jgi:soluble lytic murein transglycosylase-like protein